MIYLVDYLLFFCAAHVLDAAQAAGTYGLVDRINDLRARKSDAPGQCHRAVRDWIAEASYRQQAL